VILTPQGDPTTGSWFLSSQNPNFTILQKSTNGLGPTTLVQISRPNSLIR
jgi:hypothetical protein